MNKDQLARLARHRKVQQVLTDQADAVAAVPAFARLVAQYQQQLALLDGPAQKKGMTSQGATLAKSAVGTALIARLVKAANALYLLYKASANLEDAAKMYRRASDYTSMTDQRLATEALNLSQRVTAHAKNLETDYNLGEEATKSLAADAASFNSLLTGPQLAIDAAKIKGATAKATLRALNIFLKEDLRAGMELLKDTHPAAYQALREASQVDDARYRKAPKQSARPGSALLVSDAHFVSAVAAPAGTIPPHAIDLQAPAGTQILVSASYSHNTTVTKTIYGVGEAVNLTPAYQPQGTVSSQILYQFNFYTRPWSLSFSAKAGSSVGNHSVSSGQLGLPDGGLGSPDTLEILVDAQPQQPVA